MALEIKQIEPQDIKRKFVFYGLGGAGKTFLAATANHDPRLSPALLVCLEGGLDALEEMENPPDYVEAKNEQGRWDISTVEEIFWKLASNDPQYARYKTIIFDTYSEGHAAQLAAEARKRAGKDLWETAETLSQYEYVQTNRKMRDIVTKLRDLDRHIIVTCHAARHGEKRGESIINAKWGFAVSEGSREPLERLFSVVGFLNWYQPPAEEGEESKTIRVLYNKDSPNYFSKARGAAQRIGNMANPSMTKIMDAIDGKEG